MDLNKSRDFFNPADVTSRIHIIGCGSVGSTLAENLARCGITKMTLWDFDEVESKNIVNQMFREADVGKPKVEALAEILTEINPEIGAGLKLEPNGWDGKLLSGYIFLCVDNIDLRRQFVEQHKNSPVVKAIFDFRTGLTSAQHYAADWSKQAMKEALLNSMQFSHAEAAAETPVSACGITLGVAPTVRIIVGMGVMNFIEFIRTGKLQKLIVWGQEQSKQYMDAF